MSSDTRHNCHSCKHLVTTTHACGRLDSRFRRGEAVQQEQDAISRWRQKVPAWVALLPAAEADGCPGYAYGYAALQQYARELRGLLQSERAKVDDLRARLKAASAEAEAERVAVVAHLTARADRAQGDQLLYDVADEIATGDHRQRAAQA
jgi:hypothetical protein